MSIRPHPTKGPGWWYIDIGRGKLRKRLPFHGTYEEAVVFSSSIVQTRPDEVQTMAPRIKDLLVPFLTWYKKEASPRTIRDIRFSIDLYFVPWFGNLQPAQISLALCNKFKDTLLEKGLSPTTINKHFNYFSSIIKWAVVHGHCQPLGFTLPRFPRKKTVSRPKQPLTQRQVDAIYKHLDHEYRLPFLLMADHGLRVEEALNMKVEDINEANSTMTFIGKGSKNTERYLLCLTGSRRSWTKCWTNELRGHFQSTRKPENLT